MRSSTTDPCQPYLLRGLSCIDWSRETFTLVTIPGIAPVVLEDGEHDDGLYDELHREEDRHGGQVMVEN